MSRAWRFTLANAWLKSIAHKFTVLFVCLSPSCTDWALAWLPKGPILLAALIGRSAAGPLRPVGRSLEQHRLNNNNNNNNNGSSAQTVLDPVREWAPSGLPVIKHIPKSARPACTSHFAAVLRAIVAKPTDNTNWLSLFNWGVSVLQPPKRGGKRHNLTSNIKRRISEFSPGAVLTPSNEFSAIVVSRLRLILFLLRRSHQSLRTETFVQR